MKNAEVTEQATIREQKLRREQASQLWDLGTCNIIRKLHKNGPTVNPLKSKWAVTETNWLRYWLTPRGLKPWKQKIDAILRMDRPCNAT